MKQQMKQQNDFMHRAMKAGLLLPIVLAACSDEMNLFRPDDGANGLRFELQASIDQTADTRADESGFADGDRFGLFVVNYSGGSPAALTLSDNQVNNVAMTYSADANAWQAATDIYWRDPVTPADVYGYYPFYNGMADVNAYNFEVRADQNVAAEGEMCAYEASDLLWAKTPKAQPGKKVELTFSHVMAGVKVVLEQGSGFDGDAWTKLEKTVTVDNTIRTSEVDLSTGVVTPTGNFDRNVVMNPEGDAWRAVVVPQTVAAGKSTIGITIDGKPYVYTRADGMKYTAGKLHTFTIKIDRKADSGDFTLTLTGEDITPWEADKSSHDFESNSYLVVHVAEAGTLRSCLRTIIDDPSDIKNLKISGRLTESDFDFLRNEISLLESINLQTVQMQEITKEIVEYNPDLGYDEWVTVNLKDELPEDAFFGMSRLRRVILPESLKSIGKGALADLNLQSDLYIPDGVTIIKDRGLSRLRGNISVNIPKSLEVIKDGAFEDCSANVDLKLPKTLKRIEFRAFYSCENASGVFSLPPDLEYLGEDAFNYCGYKSKNITGEIEIPVRIKKIPDTVFSGMGFSVCSNLKFHEGVSEIGSYSFSGINFSSPVIFPTNLQVIGMGAFSGARLVGDLAIPSGLTKLGARAFSYSNISGSIQIPKGIEELSGDKYGEGGPFANSNIERLILGDNIEQIGAYSCNRCRELQYVEIGKNVSLIDDYAFADCQMLNTIVCYSSAPPAVGEGVFNGVDLSHCVLEVPENSVESYRHDGAWKIFPNITPHHELGLSVSDIKALNKGFERFVGVRAESAWEIIECPSWIEVSDKEGDAKKEISVKIMPMSIGSGNREGKVIFKLKNAEYTNYLSVSQYDFYQEEDKEIKIQAASASGKSINMVIIGEGYGAESIINGDYMNRVNETIEQFFSIEPYKTYRNMFSVSTVIALSPDNGAQDLVTSRMTKFNLTFPDMEDSMDFIERIEDVKRYVCSVSSGINSDNIDDSLIIILSNYNAFGGSAYMDDSGCALAMFGISSEVYPYDNRALVQYFAGGAAFGGIASESISHMDNIKGCSCPYCNRLPKYHSMKSRGLFENVTISGNMSDSPWYEFIFHPKYSALVDMYEGGYDHLRGVWRSEPESVMSNYIPYYNTISRYAIYKQIMKRAGLTPSLEEFINNDKIEIPN